MMYALLKDGMEIKEGDEYYKYNRWFFVDFDIGRVFHWYQDPIRRKLSTMEEVEEFYKECEK